MVRAVKINNVIRRVAGANKGRTGCQPLLLQLLLLCFLLGKVVLINTITLHSRKGLGAAVEPKAFEQEVTEPGKGRRGFRRRETELLRQPV